ncbi:hypothetical protein AB433_01210 [Croceicoccus naphthovorans]|uniref:Uncharacterized protein n=1 Tax=Croceicoccus naphthovorans TaxID=1348774 RepID=A0A0G3XCI7_9SPHN|nr:hypothetical protein AB433_01210 [Croceicoccus naphthovorans]
MSRGQGRSVGGTRLQDKIRASFGTQFVEVRVHAEYLIPVNADINSVDAMPERDPDLSGL